VTDPKPWARTPEGKVVLRLIEAWEAGVTEHGDIVMCFTSSQGNDPAVTQGVPSRSQFICTPQDARQIAQMLLRTLAFCEQPGDFAGFCERIRSPALQAVARHWNRARGSRRMPAWGDIQSECIAPWLGAVWGYDYDRTEHSFTGRLSGANIMQGFGRSFLGAKLHELYQPHVMEIMQSVLVRVVSERSCVRFSGDLVRAGDRVLQGERLMLPMGDDPDHPDGVLGVSHWDHTAPTSPDSFEVLFDHADWCKI